MATRLTYKDAGVDLDVYRDAMRELPRLMRRTFTPRVIDQPGGFAGMFRLDYNSRLFARNYREPVLVAGTDGVGTKLKVAGRAGRHNTVGIDLVAMCVNDCLCVGAEPLFFLDYVALPQDDPALLKQIVQGVSDGCYEAECALLGGETAILPEVYRPGDYDLAGFCVGVVERQRMLDGRAVRPGDVVLGLASSGLHSNGFSLVRKIVFDHAGLDVDAYVPELQRTVGEALLEPTRIYVRCLRSVLAHYRVKSVVHAVAHITGGGLAENIARILPVNRQVVLWRGSWPVPPVFTWLEQLGNVAPEEMDRVFNLGIGLVLIVSPYFADSITRQLADARVATWMIGEVRHGERGVVWAE